MTTDPSTMPVADDRDLLAGGPVDALVAAVYRDLAALEGEVLWAEHRADATEDRLRRTLERRAQNPAPVTSARVAIDRCAHTARAHVDGAVTAARAQAEAIVADARARADDLVAAARADRPQSSQPVPSGAPPVRSTPTPSEASVGFPPGPERASFVRPTAPGPATPPPAGATPRGSVPAQVGRSAPDLPAHDAVFERFWADSELAANAPGALPPDRFFRGLASTMAVVVVVLLLLLQLT